MLVGIIAKVYLLLALHKMNEISFERFYKHIIPKLQILSAYVILDKKVICLLHEFTRIYTNIMLFKNFSNKV
jgi:RecJ-like exonuclease